MQPTPYTEVNAILGDLLARVQAILGADFVGMYLYGSLATGTFDPNSSDIDFLVATRQEVTDTQFAALREMHHAIGQGASKWANQLEGAYMSVAELRRYSERTHPHIDRDETTLKIVTFHTDWVVQRYILREHGIWLAGPPIRDLIDPISADDLRQAMVPMMDMWWTLMLADPTPLVQGGPGYQTYGVLTMCRVLYTFETGAVVPKGVAAQWAMHTLDEPYSQWAQLANENRNGTPEIGIPQVQAMIQLAIHKRDAFVTQNQA
ncbi:DUF4111 domain-containing protein [Phototrophicus methaneseepsis]|uniref:DUF4111 domain-containing protein n=1 Tax=Phototrophicus methaneseepsis TaxID=2710758 RepID=A0A7S8EA91_9CHLR|nr:aminoglycoside adenylyltransferase domain-containing protein [Phototrophicus methaneseepsis]QPC83260.1 DUF4111 domain-containing protein [Phototrophicus methaneseepsis]